MSSNLAGRPLLLKLPFICTICVDLCEHYSLHCSLADTFSLDTVWSNWQTLLIGVCIFNADLREYLTVCLYSWQTYSSGHRKSDVYWKADRTSFVPYCLCLPSFSASTLLVYWSCLFPLQRLSRVFQYTHNCVLTQRSRNMHCQNMCNTIKKSWAIQKLFVDFYSGTWGTLHCPFKSRVGHRILFRSDRIVLLLSLKERNVLFSSFWRLMRPKRTMHSFAFFS